MTTHLRTPKFSRHSLVFILLAIAAFCANTVYSQQEKHGDDHPDVTLNINSELGMCDFDLSPLLTQQEWARATREVGNAIYLEPLAAAQSLGKGKWAINLENNSFHVDQESGAWNNTFHHPDSTHYLTGASGRLSVPGIRFRIGITDRWDAGVYYTSAKPFGANYGFLGFESKYMLLNNSEKGWAVATRASYVMDAAIKDFNISSTGLEVLASKKLFGVFIPYAGIATNWNHGREVTSDIDLHNENSLAVRGIVGLEFRWKFVNLGYECQIGDGMAQRSLKLGVVF
jgi:hypothetical protein